MNPGIGTQFKALRPERPNLKSDLIAGLTFAVVNIPQAMAHALLATVNPVLGIYTLMMAVPIGALFTSSVYMNIDSTGAIAATAGSMLLVYSAEERPFALAILTLLVVVPFVPRPAGGTMSSGAAFP